MPEVATKGTKAGWRTVAFGDVVRQVKDKVDPEESGLERYVAGEHMDTDDLHIRRWGEIGDGNLGPAFHMRFKPGQVLYGSRRTYLRKIAVADFEGITANTTYVMESADQSVLLTDLLPFIMQTEAFTQHSIRESKGSVNPYVNFSDLAWFEFVLPPINEQERILEALQNVESFVFSFDQLVDSAVLLEHSVGEQHFKSVISDSGSPLSEAMFEDINRVDVVNSCSYRTVGVLNAGEGLFVKDELRGLDTNYAKLNVLRQNQIVMRKLTAWEGAIAVVPPEHDGAVVSSEFPTMTLRKEKVLPEYATWLVRQPRFWTEMKARSRGTALRRSRLHQRDLLTIYVDLPSLEVQRHIASVLSEIREARDSAKKRVSEARRCLHMLRELLLSGKADCDLKLPKDPHD